MGQTEAGEEEEEKSAEGSQRARSQMHTIGASIQMLKIRACKRRGQDRSGILVCGGASRTGWCCCRAA